MATFDVKGFVSWYTITGTFNGERFLEALDTVVVRAPRPAPRARAPLPAPWLAKTDARALLPAHPQLPYMNPFPGKRSILILDNASIHHSQRVLQRLAAASCLVLFTPPYCFTLTPLDNGGFGAVKTYLQREQPTGSMVQKMDKAFLNSVSESSARYFLRKCGYGAIM